MTDLGRVSVCVATFNGRAFVEEQLQSILAEVGVEDEVVVVDDGSTDGTADVVRAIGDRRIRLVERTVNRGYVATFEEALGLAVGDHVFLADQDDRWPPGRVETMQRALVDHQVVAGNVGPLRPGDGVRPVGAIGSWRLPAGPVRRRRWTTVRLALSNAPYYGSAMAVRRDLLDLALPFPRGTELHDAWLVLLALRAGSLAHVDDDVVLRRIHATNTSGRPRSLHRVALGRWRFVRSWWAARRRVRG